MKKRVFWKQTILAVDELSDWLTAHNIQPTKFKICYMPVEQVLVTYIDREISNED
jgi:hypothetical protein